MYLFPTFLILIQFSSSFLIIVNVCSLCLLLGTTGQTVTVACNDGYSGGGIATCGTSGEFNTLTCTVTAPKSVSLLVSKNDQLQIEITPPDVNGDITHYEGSMRVAYPSKPVGELQSIETVGANSWKHFNIGLRHFLVVANYYDGTKSGDAIFDLKSKIYEYDATLSSEPFQEFQSIDTKGAQEWEHFEINGETYLVVANYQGGTTQDSIIYKFDKTEDTNPFKVFQTISTSGASDWKYFSIGSGHFLVVANYKKGTTQDDSIIYKFDKTVDPNQFQVFQRISTSGAIDWEFFTIESTHYLAVASYGSAAPPAKQDSFIYKYTYVESDQKSKFIQMQTIKTIGAHDFEYFTMNDKHYLVAAFFIDGSSKKNFRHNSIIYEYDADAVEADAFQPLQYIPTTGARSWTYYQSGSKHFLAVAQNRNNDGTSKQIDSIIFEYNAKKNQFQQKELIQTDGANSFESFFIGDKHFLALANEYNDVTSSHTTNSIIYDRTTLLITKDGTSSIKFPGAGSTPQHTLLKTCTTVGCGNAAIGVQDNIQKVLTNGDTCQPGTYQNEKNQASCKTCDARKYSALGSSSCYDIPCPVGHFSKIDRSCETCPESTYQDQPSHYDGSTCKTCTTTSCSSGTTMITGCTKIADRQCSVFICTCPNGTPTIAAGSGATLCDMATVDCSECDTGYTMSAPAASGSAQTCNANTCTPTEVANSNKAGTGSITGTLNNFLTISCLFFLLFSIFSPFFFYFFF